jgi:polyketide biosynthesis enoyl-CoA hydratase PksH
MTYETIRVRVQEPFCFLQLHRPEARNTINDRLVDECLDALAACEASTTAVVLEGLGDVFCFGADFQQIRAGGDGSGSRHDPERLYELWTKLATGPYVTIAHVRGAANAGGVGFVAACDIALADPNAQFSLSELLFGLIPACVLPFLVRRVGFQRAHYMTLMTQPISAAQAQSWQLIDACEADSQALLRKHLLRLRYLTKTAIRRYKRYAGELDDALMRLRSTALSVNRDVFGDPQNLQAISRYADTGLLPWQR